MPLILDSKNIHSINGPISCGFLQQTNLIPTLNNNYLVFFGDEHNMKNFEPCHNDINCSELQTDFIDALNTFASTTRTDFYVEDFMGLATKDVITKKDFTTNPHYNQYKKSLELNQEVYKNLRTDPTLKTLDKSSSQDIIKQYESEIQKNPYRIRNSRSNLTELISLYNSCFYKDFNPELCPYKNINWQFADARKINKYLGTSYSIENITFSIDMLNKFILENFDSDNKKQITNDLLSELSYDMLEMSYTNIIDILTDINIILTDTSVYIEKLLDRQIFKKQLDKMNEETKSIFSNESFILLADTYKKFFTHVNFQGFKNMIELLINFFT